jgi:tetratricopeptide (TPR) repeat protein
MSARDLYNAGVALQQKGRCTRAMPYFNSAIAHNAMYVNALRGRAQCAEALGADDVAIADLTAALRADSRNYGLLLNRADAETDNGSTGRAQSDALAALRLVPPQVPAYDSVAQSLYNVADLADAVATINLAVRVLPSDPTQYALRAKYRAAMLDYRGAEADYSRAIGLSLPHDQVDLYRNLADVQDQMQDYPAARGSIASAIARQPHDPGLYLDAATIERDAGNDGGALRRYTQALSHGAKGDDALQAHEGRGDMLAALHHKTAAAHAYRAALSLTRDRGRRAEIRAKIKALSH